MDYAAQFNRFAADFEACLVDDDWSRLASYLADNATYRNIAGPEGTIRGRDAILAFFEKDVSESDRPFETRRVEGLTEPEVKGQFLSRKWRCTYTLSQVPDLVVEGEARYWFDGDLITAIEQELSPESAIIYAKWMQEHEDKLHT